VGPPRHARQSLAMVPGLVWRLSSESRGRSPGSGQRHRTSAARRFVVRPGGPLPLRVPRLGRSRSARLPYWIPRVLLRGLPLAIAAVNAIPWPFSVSLALRGEVLLKHVSTPGCGVALAVLRVHLCTQYRHTARTPFAHSSRVAKGHVQK